MSRTDCQKGKDKGRELNYKINTINSPGESGKHDNKSGMTGKFWFGQLELLFTEEEDWEREVSIEKSRIIKRDLLSGECTDAQED